MEFSEEEVKEELRALGYENIPRDKLSEFMTDLQHLMRHEQSRTESDLSIASSAATSSRGDGLSRYPQHTSFHWGKKNSSLSSSSSSSPRNAFEKTKVSLDESSFLSETCNNIDRENSRLHHLSDQEITSPKHIVDQRHHQTRRRPATAATTADDSIVSSSSTNSVVVRRKILRRDADGNHDIATEELTYVEDDDDNATVVDGDGFDDDEEDCRTTVGRLSTVDDDYHLTSTSAGLPRRVVVGSSGRPRSAGSESSSSSSSSSRFKDGVPLPSFIRTDPEVRRRRHDPVNRYHQYKEAWTSQRAPGEKQHKQLRWAVREQMQRREEIVTPVQRYYCPNDFVPPTDKKRQDLRWEIRTKLAHKMNPSKTHTGFNIWM